MKDQFLTWRNFMIYHAESYGAVVAGFRIGTFEVEIFGQNIPVEQQHGYRHMIAEHQLLLENGADLRRRIIDLKKQGYKTEPAFAFALGLKGDPYEALLKYKAKKCTP